METIFYSWQSDTPSSINRNFIRDALKEAIEKVAESLGLEEAPRLDQDTLGVPGTPEIANSILKKIESCSVFIPDLTIVAHTNKKEPIPNPNVLIEYGYAMKTIGSEHIISVMNEVFGSAEDSLPFDLKHRRWPIRYSLTEGASTKTRKEQKERLISQLETALRTVIEAGLLNRNQKVVGIVQPVWKSSSFMSNADVVAKAIYPSSPSAPRDIVWYNGPQAFLRIIPTTFANSWKPFELMNLIKSGGLIPMGGTCNSLWILRNTNGAVYVSGEDNGNPDTYIEALCLTQVFRNGEIWGIDRNSLKEKIQTKAPQQYIPGGFTESLFTKTLRNYLDWAKGCLKLNLPLKYTAGLSGITGYSISIDSHTIGGYCVDDEVINTGEITDYDVDIADILIPFFKDIWECCGLTKPERRS